jgi:hypothetical protein
MYEFSLSPLTFPTGLDPLAPASEDAFSVAAGTAVGALSCLAFFLRALFDSPVTRFESFETISEAICSCGDGFGDSLDVIYA